MREGGDAEFFRIQRRLLGLLLTFTIGVGACTGVEPPLPPRISLGGTLRVGVIGVFGWCPLTLCGSFAWDPQVSYSNFGYELGRCCLLRTLLSYNGQPTGGGGGVIRPDLAMTLPEISPDGLTWTFRIRGGIRYAPPLEEVTVTTPDFVRAIERALSPRPAVLPDFFGDIHDYYLGRFLNLAGILQGGEAYANGSADRIAGLETPDPRTLVVHLAEPTGTLGAILAFPDMAPIPENPFDPEARFGIATDQGRYFGRYLAATGPYMVEGAENLDYSKPPEEWQQPVGDGAATYTLVRNPSWNRSTDPLRLASPDRIVVSRVANERDAFDLVSSGALDLVWDWVATPQQLERARSLPGVAIEASTGDNVRLLGMNVAIPPLDDVHVRRAIAYTIDRPAILSLFMDEGNFSGRVLTHVGLDSLENNLLLNLDPFSARDGPDLEAARAEMARSRYDRDTDGFCDAPDCDAIDVLAPANDPQTGNGAARAEAARLIADQLRAIGLGVRAMILPNDEFGEFYGRPQEHIAMRVDAWYKDSTSGAIWFPPLFGGSGLAAFGLPSEYMVGASPRELERWGYDVTDVPNVDGRIRSCLDQVFEAQLQCWAELDRHLTEDVVPWVPLLEATQVMIVSSRLRRYSVDQSANAPVAALDQLVVPPGDPPVESPSARPTTYPDIPPGIYRATLTIADFLRAGLPAGDEGVLSETGTFTMVIDDGL
jgi:peptide/nickel transport system substrate-binding protein